jgi:hypothetical protein
MLSRPQARQAREQAGIKDFATLVRDSAMFPLPERKVFSDLKIGELASCESDKNRLAATIALSER